MSLTPRSRTTNTVFLFVIGQKRPALDLDKSFFRIRCPQCQWRPAKHDTWVCDPGCGHVWNTFETGGVCPGCAKTWHETACHRCHQWSLHDDWYERESG